MSFLRTDEEDHSSVNDDAIESSVTSDVTSGGIVGAVGGGIVGGFAGGAVGAVIGAVIGGGASAVAVDMITHKDRDAEVYASDSNIAELLGVDVSPYGHTGRPSSGPVAIFDRAYAVREPSVPVSKPVDYAEDWIRFRAYELWEERGRQCGLADRDWFDAEREYQEQLYAHDAVEDLSNPQLLDQTLGYSS